MGDETAEDEPAGDQQCGGGQATGDQLEDGPIEIHPRKPGGECDIHERQQRAVRMAKPQHKSVRLVGAGVHVPTDTKCEEGFKQHAEADEDKSDHQPNLK